MQAKLDIRYHSLPENHTSSLDSRHEPSIYTLNLGLLQQLLL